MADLVPSSSARVSAFAATHLGLESILRDELVGLGVDHATIEPGGVGFDADTAVLVRANLCLRTASRILIRWARFHARTFGELERHVGKLEWARVVSPGARVHFRVTSKKSKLYHEDAVAERLAAAVAKSVPGTVAVASRADVDASETDPYAPPTVQRFVVRFLRDECQLSLDSSGAPLHRRGYRLATAKAPIRETLAAGLLLASGWTSSSPLIDPFCGSGTIPIEAAMMARRIPPGGSRRFGFELWPWVDREQIGTIRQQVVAAVLPTAGATIIGSDRDEGAIEAASSNADRAGVANDVEWRRAAISELVARPEVGWVVTNPPYGARIDHGKDLRDLYAQLGHVLRRSCPGWQVAIVDADRRLSGQAGVRWRELTRTENGGLPVRFLAASV